MQVLGFNEAIYHLVNGEKHALVLRKVLVCIEKAGWLCLMISLQFVVENKRRKLSEKYME